ncbi:MAG: aspartate aminotransferase family protein [Clostridiales bacterium]|nr:aspartate aminotransferase family protein [Clostridiales bacterium]
MSRAGELRAIPGPKSQEIKRDLFDYESGGTYWRVTFDSAEQIPVFVRQSDVRQWDADGNEYIDTYGPFAASCLGHTPDVVIDAVYKQAKTLMHVADMPNLPRAELVKALAAIAPGDMRGNCRVHTEIGGGPAVELALQLAEYYAATKYPEQRSKRGIISYYGAYHGRMSAGVTCAPNAYHREGIPQITNPITRVPFPYCYRCFYGHKPESCNMFCLKALKQMFETPECGLYDPATKTSLVSTLIVEPAQFHGGGVFPPEAYFKGVREICDEYGIAFIADEIAIGMGRTGKWWCIEHYGVTPDLIVTSKALSGGVWPLSAVLGKKEVMDVWSDKPDKHMGTWHGSALGCKAAVATISEIQRLNLLDACTQMGDYFKARLKALQEKHRLLGLVEGIGLGLGIELVRDRETKEPADTETKFVVRRALEYGVLINLSSYYGNRMTFMPPYTIQKADIDTVVDVLDRCLSEAEAQF